MREWIKLDDRWLYGDIGDFYSDAVVVRHADEYTLYVGEGLQPIDFSTLEAAKLAAEMLV